MNSNPPGARPNSAAPVSIAGVRRTIRPSAGECLSVERLVWAGARAGAAYLKRPLPLSMVADTCAFRPAVLAALREHGVTWRTVFENGGIETTAATVRADFAVTAWLAFTASPELDILPAGSGLPELPSFAINLLLPRYGAGAATTGLARHVRDGLVRHRHAT